MNAARSLHKHQIAGTDEPYRGGCGFVARCEVPHAITREPGRDRRRGERCRRCPAYREEDVEPRMCRGATDLLVQGIGAIAELQHFTENSDATRALRGDQQ